jgi:hypothetical protein
MLIRRYEMKNSSGLRAHLSFVFPIFLIVSHTIFRLLICINKVQDPKVDSFDGTEVHQKLSKSTKIH